MLTWILLAVLLLAALHYMTVVRRTERLLRRLIRIRNGLIQDAKSTGCLHDEPVQEVLKALEKLMIAIPFFAGGLAKFRPMLRFKPEESDFQHKLVNYVSDKEWLRVWLTRIHWSIVKAVWVGKPLDFVNWPLYFGLLSEGRAMDKWDDMPISSNPPQEIASIELALSNARKRIQGDKLGANI